MRNDSGRSIYVDSLTHRVSRSFAIFWGDNNNNFHFGEFHIYVGIKNNERQGHEIFVR